MKVKVNFSVSAALPLSAGTFNNAQPNCLSGASFWQPYHVVRSAWLEHGPFAFWLIETLRPQILVELGTHNGFSYMGFCQAIRQLRLPTTAFAVDTWQGDEHAGFYGQEVFTQLSTRNDAHYADFSRLLRCRFDEALDQFADGSIDLLHIDGRHTYADVRQDFEDWLPKLSRRAVVLFHDTNVRSGDFGVWRYWSELSTRYPAFEFLHGHGLGVLAVGPDAQAALQPLFDVEHAQVEAIRSVYGRLGQGISREYLLGQTQERLSEAHATVARLALIEQSLFWRATRPARRVIANLPKPVGRTLRRGAKALWWVLTPHRLPARVASMRARAGQRA
ncbi:MAG: class I SAM-dependent methyltransferase [Pseudomonadota bacterium]